MTNNLQVRDILSKLPDTNAFNALLTCLNREAQDLLSKSSPEIMEIVSEYARLATLQNPSEQEADRMESLLDAANHSEILSFWMVEVDHFLGHYLGLLNEDHRESYRDQQALMKEYYGMEISPTPTDRSNKPKLNQHPDNSLRHC